MQAAGFNGEEIRNLQAIAMDLQQANRSLSAVKVPGQSNTAQDSRSTIGRFMDGMKMHGGAVGIGSAAGAGIVRWHGRNAPVMAGAAVGGLSGTMRQHAFRQAGIQRTDELVRDAMLDPALAKMLLVKLSPKQASMFERNIGSRLQAMTAGVASAKAGDDNPGKRQPLELTVTHPANR